MVVSVSVEQLAIGQRKDILFQNYDLLQLVTGRKGQGKSTYIMRYAFASSTKNWQEVLKQNAIWPKDSDKIAKKLKELQEYLARYEPIPIDEAVKGANSEQWQRQSNKAVFEIMQMNREVYIKDNVTGEQIQKGNNAILFAMPNFKKFTTGIRDTANTWIKIPTRGLGIIQANTGEDIDDAWYLDEINKKAKEYRKKNHISALQMTKADFMNIYSEIPTFFGFVTFNSLSDEQAKLYAFFKAQKDESPEEKAEEQDGPVIHRTRLYLGRASLVLESIAKEIGRFDLLSQLERAKVFGMSNSTLSKCENLAKFVDAKKRKEQQTKLEEEERLEKELEEQNEAI